MNYDPTSISDIVFGSQNSKDLIDLITTGKLPFPQSGKNGLLIYGTFGTGKTSLAKLLPDVIEATHSGGQALVTYEAIRKGNDGAALVTRIDNICHRTPYNGSKYQYFILDEVDNLHKDAMQSLRSVMNTQLGIFILTTNNLSKIEKGVKSRSHLLDFNAAPPASWLPLFKRILVDENCPAPPDATLLPLIAPHNGCARDIVSEAYMLASRIKLRQSSSTPYSATVTASTGSTAATPGAGVMPAPMSAPNSAPPANTPGSNSHGFTP